ncbi:Chloride channel core [Methylobacterium sp. 4-46]|uniref:chloride channel protein n=1 Tax=unclassified Methylobacterium TaxID=2615210 RepID=UPI000152D6B5|nr:MULTISPECIES: chloride channel protein [Methylobacterium]ACA20435.1 Chloride channel core [Methylobacterium sp. 4-46]WFT79606.1 chloride channel protein [Methylobacterium nodulans]
MRRVGSWPRVSGPLRRRIIDPGTRRALFLVGGLCVGAAAVLMAQLADAAQAALQAMLGVSPLLALAVTPLGFGLAALLARTIFPNSEGSGIPQVIAARHIADPARRAGLVSLRVAFGKIVVMTLGLLCGASTGREGPTVQVGAALMAAAGRRAPEHQRGLLLAGGAAGVAAAFNTPLAGIVFGIEELSRSFEARTSGLVLGTVIAAGLTSLALVGNYAYFGTTAASLPFGPAWLAVPLFGLLGGVCGGLFSRIVIAAARGLPGRPGALMRAHPIAFAMLCGLGVALCGLATGGHVHGTGYAEARALLHGEAAPAPWFGPAKFAATTLSSISGIPGGLFAPSLAVGAGLGAHLAPLLPAAPAGALVLIAMVAYLAGVLQAPITSFVIVSEMTEAHALVIPLMIAALLADATSKLICPEGLYHALAAPIIARLAPSRGPA